MPMHIGPMELVIVLIVALLVLGPKRLPDAGRSLGRGMREFKDGLRGRDPEDQQSITSSTPPVDVSNVP
jgi:sec-independent protein translocase protein TatA